MLSQAVDGQWSLHTMDYYDCTRDRQLHSVMVRYAVQWLAANCSVYRSRAIAGWTSFSACLARAERGPHLRLSRAFGLNVVGSSASDMIVPFTIVAAVAVVRSAA